MTWAQAFPTLAKFVIGMIVILGVPALCRKIRFPAVVGLLLAGVLFGPFGLGLIGKIRPVADFLGELGKLLLMFFAGLEIDLNLFRQTRKEAGFFGLMTTSLPLIFGTIVALFFGYEVVAAVVIGSLLASHTLLAAPTISRLDLIKTEPIIVTYGATVMSDTLSLIVFAICVSIFKTGFSPRLLGTQVGEIAVVVPLMLWGLSALAKYAIKKIGDDENSQFIFMLAVVGVAALIVQAINLPDIVGAFLSGLAVNTAVKASKAKEKLKFLGESLFIPIFFISTGFIISPSALSNSLTTRLPLAIGVVAALMLGKWIAARILGGTYHYSRAATRTVWSLTLPQVAATLAAALVARQTVNAAGKPLVDDHLLNVVFVLMVVTAILGPFLTERFAGQFSKEVAEPAAESEFKKAA